MRLLFAPILLIFSQVLMVIHSLVVDPPLSIPFFIAVVTGSFIILGYYWPHLIVTFLITLMSFVWSFLIANNSFWIYIGVFILGMVLLPFEFGLLKDPIPKNMYIKLKTYSHVAERYV